MTPPRLCPVSPHSCRELSWLCCLICLFGLCLLKTKQPTYLARVSEFCVFTQHCVCVPRHSNCLSRKPFPCEGWRELFIQVARISLIIALHNITATNLVCFLVTGLIVTTEKYFNINFVKVLCGFYFYISESLFILRKPEMYFI